MNSIYLRQKRSWTGSTIFIPAVFYTYFLMSRHKVSQKTKLGRRSKQPCGTARCSYEIRPRKWATGLLGYWASALAAAHFTVCRFRANMKW